MNKLAIYVQGDIYPSNGARPDEVVRAITRSNLTTPILALLHVNGSEATCPNGKSPPGSHDGDITFNETLIIRDGKYVGDPSWPATIRSLRAGKVAQIFAAFGGYGVPDFQRIGQIIEKYGTGPVSPLYQNFACLKQTLGVDGIDFDDEDAYDQNTIVDFARMLLGMDLQVTFCPYTNRSFWSGCIDALGPKNVSWLNLQCYAGGKSNNPRDWAGLGVPLVPGVCANCCCPQTTCSYPQVEQAFSLWTTGQGSVDSACWAGSPGGATELAGGFIWTYHDVADQLDAYVDAMSAGLGGATKKLGCDVIDNYYYAGQDQIEPSLIADVPPSCGYPHIVDGTDFYKHGVELRFSSSPRTGVQIAITVPTGWIIAHWDANGQQFRHEIPASVIEEVLSKRCLYEEAFLFLNPTTGARHDPKIRITPT